jgi:hypothetical protein
MITAVMKLNAEKGRGPTKLANLTVPIFKGAMSRLMGQLWSGAVRQD